MKKILAFILICISVNLNAELVNLDLRGQNIPIADAQSHFEEWFNLSSTDFRLFKDNSSGNLRHQAYQQYHNGTIVENCAIYVHSKNGFITTINGDVYLSPTTKNQNISRVAARKVAGVNDTVTVKELIVHEGNNFYRAYKMMKGTDEVYVDMETGKIIKVIPTVLNESSVNCSIETKYSLMPNQTIECVEEDGVYTLANSSKNIVTYSADMTQFFYAVDHNTGNGQMTNPQLYKSGSSNWASYHYLTSVTITGLYNNWWDNILGTDGYPEIYIRIEDGSGRLIYVSDYKLVTTCPVTFYIADMIRIPTGGGSYKIKVYDRDEGNLDSDDLGSTITLNSNNYSTYTWGTAGSSNVCGKFTISKWNPALDVQWGLEKIYDFYHDVVGISGFDDNNSPIKACLHSVSSTTNVSLENSRYCNAFAYGLPSDPNSAFLYFGLGNEKMNSEVGLNTISHEFTHLVTKYRPLGEFVYQGESGAINEGYSDAMAITAEYYILGNTDWKYDKETFLNSSYNFECVRDLAHPDILGVEGYKPTTYGGSNWVDVTNTSKENDYGGVHANNSIFTYWYYLTCHGGNGTNDNGNAYNVQGLGIPKGLEIIWAVHHDYAAAQATFASLRQNTLDYVEDVYGKTSQEYNTVSNAWSAVGVGTNEPDFELTPGYYAIVASRATTNDDVWYYMTSDLGSASTKRYQAVSTGTSNIDAINLNNLASNYVWELVADGNNWKLKNGSQFSTWTSGNSANFDATGKSLTFEIADNQVQAHFNDGTAERYLALNKTTGNNYFAYYSGTAQQTYLYFLPIAQEETYTVRVKKPADWGNTITAWVWKNGETGHWENLSKDGIWYVYSGQGEYNIIFVNGTTWNGDNNQTIDIAVFSDKCMQIGSETSGKRSCGNISCDDDPEPPVRTDCKTLPYAESFGTSQGDFTIENVALDGLSYVWTYASGYGMKASAYVSNVNHPTESWLISPCLELPENVAINLTFDHVYRYTSAPTSDLTLLVSEDYVSGAPSTATWTPVAIPTYSSGSNWTFVNAGNIDLSTYAGMNVTLAFRYKSSSSAAATWEIKNVSVTSSSITTGVDEVLNPNNATKCFINGQLIILRDGHKFTATGTMIE